MQGDGIRIVRSDGEELWVTAGPEDGWHIEAEGLSEFLDLPIELSTSANVLSDGSTLISSRVAEAERTATIVYAGPRDPAQVRDEALSFFTPTHNFEVHVTHLGRTRWCEGRLSARKCVIQPSRCPCRVTFTILCLDPYMRSEDGNENSLTDAEPMFGFPYVSHMRQRLSDGSKKPVGFLASKMLYDGLNTVYNSGDVETYYVIHTEFDGSIENPRFTKDDRFVEVRDTFSVGDVLEIDFVSAPPKVTKNGADIMHLCSRDSNFVGMAMRVGANVFQYSCSNSANRPLMDVQIRFHKRYSGV